MSVQTDAGHNTESVWNASDLQRYLRGFGGLAVFLAVWWAGALLTQPTYLIPTPAESAWAFLELFTT